MSGTDAAGRVAAEVTAQDVLWFRAPGRVNLIGEHTDYNEGFVLPIAIDRDCIVAARPAGTIRVRSLEMDGTAEAEADGAARESEGWERLVASVARELAALGRPAAGMDAVVASDVPIGAGLSSSAAFEVACAVSLAAVAKWDADAAALAVACRAAEEDATGVPVGVMDQLISLSGREGCAVLIDCRSLERRSVRLPARMGILVVHSGQERTLAASAYAERRRACEALARKLGLAALRDATLDQVRDDPIGRHVVTENARVLGAVDALEHGDVEAFGALMNASHASLRDDYRVSTPELDALVQALVEAGAAGARLTGGGFGGAVVAACDRDRVDAIAAAATHRYRSVTRLEPQAFAVRAVDGAGPLAFTPV